MSDTRHLGVELIDHPDLFHPSADHPDGAQGFPECGEGWRNLLDRCCLRIRAAVGAYGGTFQFSQIKKKYGTARLYWDGSLPLETDARVGKAINLAKARSACTCEISGRDGRLHGRRGWLATACPEHAGGGPAPVRPGCENLRVVQGLVRIGSCRRYDRDADAFVDVDPRSLGIEE